MDFIRGENDVSGLGGMGGTQDNIVQMQEFIKKQDGGDRRASRAEKKEAWLSASSRPS